MKRIHAGPLTAVALVISATAASAATVFIPEGSAGAIRVVEAETGETLRRIPDLAAIHGLAGAPGVKYLVAGSFTEVSPEEAAAIRPQAVSEEDHAAHHAKPARAAMPSDAGLSIVTVLDAETGEVVRRIEVPGAVHHTAVSPDGRYAAATQPGGDGISLIDLETLSFAGFIATGPMPNYAVFSKNGDRLYVTNAGNGTVSEIDIERGIVARNMPAGETPEHMVMSADGKTVFVADADSGVAVELSIDSGEVTRNFPVGGEIHGIGLSDDGTELFVSGKGEDKLVAVDLSSGEQRTSSLAPAPYHLTTIPGTGMLYVSSRSEPKVWIVDQKTFETRAEFEVQGEGHQMVVLP